MKKSNKIILPVFFILFYVLFLSIGMSCLLAILGMALGASLDGKATLSLYPKFWPFCFLVGLFALIALIVLLALNIKFSHRLGYKKLTWLFQLVCAFFLSFPMIWVWDAVFEFLRKMF